MSARGALALLGALAALVLGEGVGRLHGDRLCVETPGAVYQAHARFGWIHVPHLAGWVERCTGERIPSAPVDINAMGLRDGERPYAKPPGVARVLLLGGDLPEGFGVPVHETVGRLLELRADARRGGRLAVINAGVGGFALDNDLLYFREEGIRFAPDRTLVVLDPARELTALSPVLLAAAGEPVPAKPYFRDEGGRLVAAGPPGETAGPAPSPRALGFLVHSQVVRIAARLPSRSGPPLASLDAPPAGDLAAEHERVTALARALLVALRDEVGASGGRLIAAVAPVRSRSGDPAAAGADARLLLALLADLDIPTVDLGPVFAQFTAATGRTGYFPGSAQWNSDGHFMASGAVWELLLEGGLLPAGVLPARAFGAGRPVPAIGSPRVWLASAWRARRSTHARYVAGGLVCVGLLWAGAFLPPAGRDWLLVALSLGLIGTVGSPALALLTLGYALVFHAVVERLRGPAAAVAVIALLAAFVVAPVWGLPGRLPGYAGAVTAYFARASNVALLRFAAYAYDRRRGGAPRRPLREYLGAMFFFPTFINGPIETLEEFAARRPAGAAAPASFAALRQHLVGSARALGRLGWGAVKLFAAHRFLGTLDLDVFASGGEVVGHARLWLWPGELYAFFYLTFSGWTDIAIALGRMSGSAVGENFQAPWAATDVADFWNRWHITLGRCLRSYVYIPLGGNRRHVYRNILVVFVVSALWHVWGALKILGPQVYPPAAWSGFLLWGLLNAAGVMLAHARRRGFWTVPPGEPARRTAPPRTPVARLWRQAATFVFIALCWVPFFLPPWNRIPDVLHIFARLVFER